MSMLSNIVHRIWADLFPKVEVEIEAKVEVTVEPPSVDTLPVEETAPPPCPSPVPPSRMIADILDASAVRHKQETGEDLSDWRYSIVDLLKLVGFDPSVSARRDLARALGVTNYQPTEAGNVDLSKRFLAWLRSQ